ncbi:MAG: ribbon-helix-helix protein, CopG family [Candidatus Bathyarchaeia archaeon]
MVKVLSAKVKDSVYDEFVKKAKEQGINQSEALRRLIEQNIKSYAEKPIDRIIILQESIKVLYDLKLMLANVVSQEKPKLMDYLNKQIEDFQKKLEFEKKR